MLAASGKQRSKRYPDLPTLGEFYPGLSVDIWLGVFAPPQTPEQIVTMLRTEIHKLLARPDFAERLNVSGSLEPLILSPADFSALIHAVPLVRGPGHVHPCGETGAPDSLGRLFIESL